MKIELYEDGLSYVTNDISTVVTNEANMNAENRAKFVTDLAAISRNLDGSKNPSLRFKKLLKEAAPNTIEDATDKKMHASRPLEFLPVVVKVYISEKSCSLIDMYDGSVFFTCSLKLYQNKIAKHSYLGDDNLLYTNFRALFNAGVPEDKIPFNSPEELKDFKIVKLNIPMFVFNHLITHTALSKEARSERMVEIATGNYWLPKDLKDKCIAYGDPKNNDTDFTNSLDVIIYNMTRDIVKAETHQEIVNILVAGTAVTQYSQANVMELLKRLGYKQEIYQRAMLEFRYKTIIMTGWNNDPDTFTHLVLERNGMKDLISNWTQLETEIAVNGIRHVIK